MASLKSGDQSLGGGEGHLEENRDVEGKDFLKSGDQSLGEGEGRLEENLDAERKGFLMSGDLSLGEGEDETRDEVKEGNSDTTSTETTADNSERIKEKIIQEYHFSKLFKNALDEVLQTHGIELKDHESIRNAVQDIRDSFKGFVFSETDFSLNKNLIAYFYAYSVLNTSVVRHRVLDAFNKCDDLQNSVKKENLKVVTLGGGPGTDMIGFLSVVQQFKSDSLKNIDFTIVDKWEEWKCYWDVIENLIRSSENYGNISAIFQSSNIDVSFITADLTKWEDSKRYSMEEADMVLLIRFLDTFDFKKLDRYEFLESLFARMKSGALLLLMDTTTSHYVFKEAAMIYKSGLGEFCVSSVQTEMFDVPPSKISQAYIAIYKKEIAI